MNCAFTYFDLTHLVGGLYNGCYVGS